ncbi:MAG: hypothetical protein EOO07_23915 [Chitinophagaceae bacterium]|nr:MAG: hypothetical protein EOO07_23915 [Chitinophagaceae bacterium]
MGDTAIPFKITNLLLHLITTFFVHSILLKLQFSRLASVVGTAIFALHPIHVTSIHFILGRTDLVAALFYFGTLALVLDWKNTPNIKQYNMVGATFVAALLSKEMSVTLCLMMFALVFYKQQIKNARSFMSVLLTLSPFFAITLIYTVIRIFMWSKLTGDVTGYTNYSIGHVISNYLTWFFALIYPFDLYLAQDVLIENPVRFFSVVVFISLLIFSGSLIVYGRNLFSICKSFWLWAAITWVCVTLLPICGGNPHRWYLYIPSFGLSLLFAAIVENMYKDKSRHRVQATHKGKQKILFAITGFLLVIYLLEDFRLSRIWNKQSDVAMDFLAQIKTQEIYKKDHIYIANVPFGFKSAYLFTLTSLQEAIQYYFGQSPKITAVSYVNFDEDIDISVSTDNRKIRFNIVPDHYNFFLLSANERRFNNLEIQRKEDVLVTINAIAKNKKISDYSVSIPETIKSDVYYFDGKNIKPADNIRP